jgi:hypothetical protein
MLSCPGLTLQNAVSASGNSLIEAFKQSNVLSEKGLLPVIGEGFLKESLRAAVNESNLGLIGNWLKSDTPGRKGRMRLRVRP